MKNYNFMAANFNIGEMGKFLESHKLPKRTQEQIEDFNRPIEID